MKEQTVWFGLLNRDGSALFGSTNHALVTEIARSASYKPAAVLRVCFKSERALQTCVNAWSRV